MSRLIVKNIPKGITDQKLKEIFSKKGNVTDVQLKYNEKGVFRRFGFVGFENEKDAEIAANFFNNTYINTTKINVQVCEALGNKPIKNKYKSDDQIKEVTKTEKVSKHNLTVDEIIKEHKNDPLFLEYMHAHSKDNKIWTSDVALPEIEDTKKKDHVKKKETKTEPEIVKKELKKPMIELFTLKIMNIPFRTKRSDIVKFFKPLKPHSVRIPTHGFCFAGFKNEADFQKALAKNRSFMKKNQVQIVDYCERNKKDLANSTVEIKKNSKWQKQEDVLKGEEGIDESGRIYFRNLPYSTTEEDLQKTFELYGPVADISLPVDSDTKAIKGFGTVTFVMPEHAIVAYNNLNGSSFHGRMLHLLPAKSKDKPEINTENLNPKEKKLLLQRQNAGNSYNWNSLFLGLNAIADTMATNYDTTKMNVLDTKSGGTSAAVRLALGETEIVNKMKVYLEENGVCLDAFNQAPTKLSKTTIIVKNLPADTESEEIKKLFMPFGLLRKIILPPNGVTAIIDFVETSEAKLAYKKLAYKKFKHLPLYLEWAPENAVIVKDHEVLKSDIPMDSDKVTEKDSENTTDKKSSKGKVILDTDKDVPLEDGTTIFLRNLNFLTEEKTVREHFEHVGPIHMVEIARKKDPDNPSQKISLGYGFIQFKTRSAFEHALKNMAFTVIDCNKVELKRSDRILKSEVTKQRKTIETTEQNGTKIMVRNIPFQAKESEVKDLFKAFGELKAIRLPLKMASGESSHRGFGFVDFFTKSDAKKAFDALCQSTHLFGRRLVLEWAQQEENVEQLRKRTADHFVGNDNYKRNKKGVFDGEKSNFDVENE